MRSFDPDVDEPYRDLDEAPARHVDDDIVAISADAATALLDAVTADLPGGGEVRDSQRDMVGAVAATLSRRGQLIIEAGTGVGKSLGYLVPLALSGRRAVVATATKNLQDQLASKDAPQVAAHAPGLTVSVLKGRSNYLCLLRARENAGGAQMTFDEGGEVPSGVANQMRAIIEWSSKTQTGDRDELTFDVDARAWRSLSVTPQECLGRGRCPVASACFAERARDLASESQIVIVNTALYAAHLASDERLLPEHDLVVFDEAHEIVDIFSRALGVSVSPVRLRAVATLARALLSAPESSLATDLADLADRLARELTAQFDTEQVTGLSEPVTVVLGETTRTLTALGEALRALSADSADVEHRRVRALGPLTALLSDVSRLTSVGRDELIWLVRRDREMEIELSLVDVGALLADSLWSNKTAVLASATIPDSLPDALGLSETAEILRLPSPFDYAQQALLYVPDNFPTRTSDNAEAAIIDELVALITAAGGRTLALFTNRTVMHRVADAVESRIDTPVLRQDTLSRARLLEKFRDDEASSLFAVTSYWQGVDVPGASLSLVTIDRLPFTRPDDPLSLARRERHGDRAFYEVDVPRAAMLLAQGVGRLIRSQSDRGVVAVLDTRLATASYRSQLLRRLPPLKRTRTRDDVVAFLAAMNDARA